MQLKKEGKIKPSADDDNDSTFTSSSTGSSKDNVIDRYADKIQSKMGKGKSKLLSKLKPEFRDAILSSAAGTGSAASSSSTSSRKKEAKSKKEKDDQDTEFEFEDDDYELDESEGEILERVQEKLLEQSKLQQQKQSSSSSSLSSTTSNLGLDIDDIAKQMEEEIELKKQQVQTSTATQSSSSSSQETSNQTQGEGQVVEPIQKTTSGIGGTWQKNSTSELETYRPANGGWGYFPRPKDISKAYGGGKKIERTSTLEDEKRKENSVQDTREKLRQYREKVGIEVQSEKDHAKEIEEALALGQLAMQRGVYNTAVSSLEKVTKYCSTNSKVGGKVFLELAMAYEAVGRTSEAIQVYNALSDSRMEDIKFNAKRLLYGIESMKFMREEVKSEAFSRQKVKQTFIDTTGLADIAQNFGDDKIYNTAYIDLDKGGNFYRKLTESVVRSIREARQILLRATDSGEVERTKIVQALRSIERKFNEALKEEIKRNKPKEEPIAVLNGKPIIKQEDMESPTAIGMDSLNMGDLEQTMENVSGEWKLQLMADSKGDGVSFYNKTLSWQYFDVEAMEYNSSGPAGFLTLSQSGEFEIDEISRIISRKNVKSQGSGAFLTDLLGTSSGSVAATNLQQQIISVDSEMLITRVVLDDDGKPKSDTRKDYFSVWRRAETGLYSGRKQ